MRSIWLTPLLVVLATGCIRESAIPLGWDTTAVEPAREAREVREIVVASDGPAEEGPAPAADAPAASPADRLRPDPVLFHLGAGYGAMGQLDLAPCKEQGLQPGYLHVRVTFRDNGRIVFAAVESPLAPPPEALACIGGQLETAMVPTFEGGDVTLSKILFVD